MISNLAPQGDFSNSQPLIETTHSLLDTLAQVYQKPISLGCRLSKTDADKYFNPSGGGGLLLKRARAKYFTRGLVQELAQQHSPLYKSYWRSWHCASDMQLNVDGTTETTYCKNRWCMVCSRIKTAELLRKHYKALSEFESPYFVTLTIPNVPGDELRATIREMNTSLQHIRRRLKYRGLEGKGIRKMECTVNSYRNDYHPHFHLIVEGEEYGQGFVDEWLKTYPLAERWCQDLKPADDNSIKELFKYFTKLISTKRGEREIYADALDVMFRAVKGTRVFQSWGYIASDAEYDKSKIEAMVTEIEETQFYEWCQDSADWINKETGEALTGYKPTKGLKNLIEKRIISRYGKNENRKQIKSRYTGQVHSQLG